MNNQRGVSLRYKLLALLVILPLTSLGFYLFMATNLFVRDKRAYVFDSSVVIARSLATQVKLEINSFKRTFHPISRDIDRPNFKFSQLSKNLFYNQKNVEWAIIYKQRNGGLYQITDRLYLSTREVRNLKLDPAMLEEMQKLAVGSGITIRDYSHHTRYFLIMESYGEKGKPDHFMTLAVYKAPEVYEAFATPSLYKSYLLSKRNSISMEPKYVRKHQDKVKISSIDFFSPILRQKLPEGTAEIVTENGQPTLVSFSEVKIGDLLVASVVDKEAAFKAVDALIYKSLLFFAALICITLLISVISSISLTSALGDLVKATKEIAKGNFKVKLNIRSTDEIGDLANGFRIMADEVSRLLVATAEQARMEHELETVKIVQETLFPDASKKLGDLDIRSHFEPASECGGDWFHYSLVGNKAFLWIGDATGHGAPAALITSAAKSASSIIEAMPETSPGQALRIMNHALNATAKGRILMTFFLASVELDTGKMVYANASHEFPYIIPQKDELKKKDLVPLCDAEGFRLGEQEDSEYVEAEYLLQPGDTIVFYTDGIIDLQDMKGQEFGERKFLKALLSSSASSMSVQGKIDSFKRSIADYRGKAILVDDVTMFMAHYDKREAS